jgi:hypothetical protein
MVPVIARLREQLPEANLSLIHTGQHCGPAISLNGPDRVMGRQIAQPERSAQFSYAR